MRHFGKGLIFKLGGVLLLLLFIKLMMIGVGIYSAGHLKGDAAAINYAGSERMRSFKLSFLINRLLLAEEEGRRQEIKVQVEEEIIKFEKILGILERGETTRGVSIYEEPYIVSFLTGLHPVFKQLLRLPGIYEPELKEQIGTVRNNWTYEIKPLVATIVNNPAPLEAYLALSEFNEKLPLYVDTVDRFVTLLEDSSNRKVMMFYGMQYFFLMLTIAVTMVALYLIFIVTKKSVGGLMDGIRAMTAGDFSKRVEKYSDDEIGELAKGFNFMAEQLEESYGSLERKVVEKTTALEERNRELSILYDLAASLNQSLPIDEILNIYLEKLLEYLDVSCGSVRMMEEDGSLRLSASKGLPDNFKKSRIALGECLCGQSAMEKEAGYWDVSARPDGMVLKECVEFGFKTVALIPIKYKDRLLGVTNLFEKKEREFTEQEKKLLESIGNHIGVAIEYYNLNAKAKKLAIMEERNILAHELHDSIAQSLAYLNIQTTLLEGAMKNTSQDEAMENIRQIKDVIQKGYNDVRELLSHFRTQMEEEGLEEAVESMLGKFSLTTGVEASLDKGRERLSLPPEAEVHVFHIIQEALANVRKHSHAAHVKVSLSGDWPAEAVVEDDGVGFEMNKLDSRGVHHMGLSIMRERAIRVGGSLNINSFPGRGTRVALSIPREVR